VRRTVETQAGRIVLTLVFPRFFAPPQIGRRCRPMRRLAVGACAPDLGGPV